MSLCQCHQRLWAKWSFQNHHHSCNYSHYQYQKQSLFNKHHHYHQQLISAKDFFAILLKNLQRKFLQISETPLFKMVLGLDEESSKWVSIYFPVSWLTQVFYIGFIRVCRGKFKFPNLCFQIPTPSFLGSTCAVINIFSVAKIRHFSI